MDALAGYGSDSSSEQDAPKTEETKSSNSLSALLGADSSDSDGDSDDGEEEKSQDVKKSFTSLQSKSQQPVVKRQKVQDDRSPKSTTLPKPPITSRSGPSMIHWDIDYLAKTEAYVQCDESESNNEVSQKLERLAATLDGRSYADHLKTQHEFHNPRFFESVVEHFGIKNPLGSHAMHSNTKFVDSECQISSATDK